MNKKYIGFWGLIWLCLAAAPGLAQSADIGAAGAGEGGAPLVLGPADAFQLAYRPDLAQWQRSRGVELVERFYEIAQTEYENGRRDLLEVEEAEIQRSEARLNLLKIYSQRISLLITLDQYTVRRRN